MIATTLRHLDGRPLREALRKCRLRTLAIFEAFEQQLSQQNMRVPLRPEINPPLWEFGHVFWFSQNWLNRNPQRTEGMDPEQDHDWTLPEPQPLWDDLFNSAILAHDDRWSAALWDYATVVEALQQEGESRLRLLDADLAAAADASPHRRYFYRLVLAHELMHQEAFHMTARLLGLKLPAAEPRPMAAPPAAESSIAIRPQALGGLLPPARGFAFDNEYGHDGLSLETEGFEVDAGPVTLGSYRRFCRESGRALPAPAGDDDALPAQHLTLQDALDYCDWRGDGSRLPTEAEWVLASLDPRVHWGEVWEWTASRFEPFEGFRPHPYREYSEPWFDGTHQVVKGASAWTDSLMVSARYRNFFQGHRQDVRVGFRTVRGLSR